MRTKLLFFCTPAVWGGRQQTFKAAWRLLFVISYFFIPAPEIYDLIIPQIFFFLSQMGIIYTDLTGSEVLLFTSSFWFLVSVFSVVCGHLNLSLFLFSCVSMTFFLNLKDSWCHTCKKKKKIINVFRCKILTLSFHQTARLKEKRLCFVVNPDPGSEHCWQLAQIYKCMSVKRGRTPGENLQTPGRSVSLPPLECHNTAHLKGGGQTGGVKLGLQIETLGTGFKIFVVIKLDRRLNFITVADKTQLFPLGTK